jgi:hypothetical protein
MELRHGLPQEQQQPSQHPEPFMNTTRIIIAIAAFATTVTLMAGIAGLVQKAEHDAFAATATTQYLAQADRTVIVVTHTA